MTLGKRLRIIGLITGCGLILSYLACLGVLMATCPPEMDEWFHPRIWVEFSQEKWRSASLSDRDRYRMANGLIRSKRLHFTTRREVIDLLGPPTFEKFADGRGRLAYELASQRELPAKCVLLPSHLFMNTDSWELEIRFENDRVESVRIRPT